MLQVILIRPLQGVSPMATWFRRPAPVRPAQSYRARLMVRALESRITPADFTVLNAANAGAGSLRQAVLDANAQPGADNILFDPAFFNAANPRTITLTAASGQMAITDDLT